MTLCIAKVACMSDDTRSTAVPRWVKVLAVVALAVALVLAAVLLAGEGHGPGRHVPAAGVSSPASWG